MADPSAAIHGTTRNSGAPSGGGSGVASGEPVDELPPMVELIGFDEPPAPPAPPVSDQRPVRRSFLRPRALDQTPGEMTPLEIPALVEPTAKQGPVTESLARWTAPLRSFRLLSKPQPKLPAVKLPTRPSPRRSVIAICVVAAIVVIGVVAISVRVGPFAPRRAAGPVSVPPPSNASDRPAYYQRLAEAGHTEAQLQLAILYAKGEGVPQDYVVAAKWFRAAADGGSARAQYDVGVLYERGRGVAADPVEASKWYLKAAEGKYPLAQFNLAVCYTKGQGVRKDLAEAALWYRRAALQGVVQAMLNLGTMYERGDGVAASQVDAYAWYLAAGRRGNQVASKRSEELFAALPKLDQIRAEALAGDVAASIHDYNPPGASAPAASQPTTGPAAAR